MPLNCYYASRACPRRWPGGLQAFFQGAAAGGKVAEPLSEGGVLSGKPLDGVGVVLALGVAEMAKQLPDAGALGGSRSHGGTQGLFFTRRVTRAP